ncbi:MAG: glycosyltransferase [Alphaproteobacteria bacterium]|nr:glycosyltransferase [Alphaproteobacteria bacterium]MDE2496156.1 glycosyltransferase [Alphaproteobacteria bacterium]
MILTKHTALVYRSALLPHSETFIREQVLSYKNWRPVMVGRRLVHQLPLDGLEVKVLGDRSNTAIERIISGFYARLGLPFDTKALHRERASLLHAHFGPDAVEAVPLARMLGIPMIVTLHGFDITIDRSWWEGGAGGGGMQGYPRALLRMAMRSDVHFIAVSRAVKTAAVRFGIPSNKVSVLYIGIDPGKFRPGPVPIPLRGHRVLFIGRLVEKKGCECLLRAMQIVMNRVTDAELTIIGDGRLRAGLENLALDLGVRAMFLGACNHEQVKAELDTARAFCLPSVRAANGDAEGFGLVLLEAQAAGVPVVSSAIGGADEGIKHGHTGFRFAERDVRDMAEKLVEILTNDERAASMAASGPRFVAQCFDLHRCTKNLEQLYDVIEARAKTPTRPI